MKFIYLLIFLCVFNDKVEQTLENYTWVALKLYNTVKAKKMRALKVSWNVDV